MSGYTIAAIPTLYQGRQYRSRLEARWAAFFDLLGWRHEYEPFDLGPWSPDFKLTEWRVLVEVKPLELFDQAVWDKITKACLERRLFETSEDYGFWRVFLTRAEPRFDRAGFTDLGWMSHVEDRQTAVPCRLAWRPQPNKPEFTAELIYIDRNGWWSASGDADGWTDYDQPQCLSIFAPRHYPDYTMRLWAQASNAVQWCGKEAQP